jgi:response regulator RpfG family c-di-GMP phosphodiesterase
LANALNECDISNFINKPWSRTQLFIIIDSALSKVKLFRENYNLNKSNEKSFFETVSLISDIITELSPQLSEYSRNVGALCVKVAEELKLDNAITQELEIAGELHCLGLLGMSPQIYQTHPHQLSGELRTVYSKYQELSAEMLKAVPRLEAVRKIILLHRENIDGTGPLELKGRQVPFDARVLRLCSHYEAAIFLRRANKQQTLSDMNRKVGTWFDRRCMQALINVITQEIGALIIPIPLKELEPGMKLGKNIYSKTGRMVLSVGATITNLNLKRLLIYNELDPIEEVFIVTSSADKA